MQTKLHSLLFAGLVLLLMCSSTLQAQFSLTGQLRTRSELRDGQGTLSQKKAVPAFFTSQRTRLNFGYNGHRFKLFTAVQDVRVWGQDASTINRTTLEANNGLMIHEAWGEIMLLDTSAALENLSLKIGRQELVYDDSRLLGNLDWLQQARRHDLALLKLEDRGWMAHLGFAFNQNRELKAGSMYNGTPAAYAAGTNGIGTLYKSMQFLYLGRKLGTGNASLLFLKDDFNKYHMEGTNRVYDRGVWSRFTTGAYLAATALKKLSLTASAYYQGGKDKDGNNMDAYLLSAYTLYPLSKQFSVGPGIDFTSGNSSPATGNTNRQFDPLYGTPHKFWGTMDYFYVADGFGRNGLVNYYIRSRYKANNRLSLSLDAHQFAASNKVMSSDGTALDRNFGTELDFMAIYTLTKLITVEGGYSSFFATPTLASAAVKNVSNADLQANWAYLMISIKPDFLSK
jgi:hypothetical protein